MTEDDQNVARIDDPAQMRALAHPTRLRILGLLRANGPQTAALLGDAIDEAPGTISYHCTRLARAGLIEAAAGRSTDRRERWWKAVTAMSVWNLAEHLDDPERVLATNALDHAVARTLAAIHEAYIDKSAQYGRDWIAAARSADALLRLTPAELSELGEEMETLVARWRQRSEAHSDDDGSERVFALTQAFRWPQ